MKTLSLTICAGLMVSCETLPTGPKTLKVDVKKQKAEIIVGQRVVKTFPVSTGKGGTGNKPRSHQTPLGTFKIVKEAGEGMPLTTGFKGGAPTKNTKGKDPIIARVLFIDGIEPRNRNSMSRCIRIHGTPYTSQIGTPVSMGCVRFTPQDIATVCHFVNVGDSVVIR